MCTTPVFQGSASSQARSPCVSSKLVCVTTRGGDLRRRVCRPLRTEIGLLPLLLLLPTGHSSIIQFTLTGFPAIHYFEIQNSLILLVFLPIASPGSPWSPISTSLTSILAFSPRIVGNLSWPCLFALPSQCTCVRRGPCCVRLSILAEVLAHIALTPSSLVTICRWSCPLQKAGVQIIHCCEFYNVCVLSPSLLESFFITDGFRRN